MRTKLLLIVSSIILLVFLVPRSSNPKTDFVIISSTSDMEKTEILKYHNDDFSENIILDQGNVFNPHMVENELYLPDQFGHNLISLNFNSDDITRERIGLHPVDMFFDGMDRYILFNTGFVSGKKLSIGTLKKNNTEIILDGVVKCFTLYEDTIYVVSDSYNEKLQYESTSLILIDKNTLSVSEHYPLKDIGVVLDIHAVDNSVYIGSSYNPNVDKYIIYSFSVDKNELHTVDIKEMGFLAPVKRFEKRGTDLFAFMLGSTSAVLDSHDLSYKRSISMNIDCTDSIIIDAKIYSVGLNKEGKSTLLVSDLYGKKVYDEIIDTKLRPVKIININF